MGMDLQGIKDEAAKVDWLSIGFYMLLVVVASVAIALSTQRLFPDILDMTMSGLLITAGVLMLMHIMTHNTTEWLRQWAIIFTVLATIGHGIDYIGHIAYSRELSAAKRNQELRQQAEQVATKLQGERTKQRVEEMGAGVRWFEAAKELLVHTPQKKKGAATEVILRSSVVAPSVAVPVASPSPSPTPSAASNAQAVEYETPEQVTARWQPRLFNILLIVTAFVFVGGAVLFGMKNWRKGGVPLWIVEKAGQMLEKEFAALHPKEYAVYGSKLAYAGKA